MALLKVSFKTIITNRIPSVAADTVVAPPPVVVVVIVTIVHFLFTRPFLFHLFRQVFMTIEKS